MTGWFERFALLTSHAAGSPAAFAGTLFVILAWAASGPLFHFSDTWQLVINTGTTLVTTLMVFLLQSTQNRDSAALHLKLDELLRASDARDALIASEQLTAAEIALEAARIREAVSAANAPRFGEITIKQ